MIYQFRIRLSGNLKTGSGSYVRQKYKKCTVSSRNENHFFKTFQITNTGTQLVETDLIEKVADVIVAEPLGLQQLVQIRLHQALHYVDVLHTIHRDITPSDVNKDVPSSYCTCKIRQCFASGSELIPDSGSETI